MGLLTAVWGVLLLINFKLLIDEAKYQELSTLDKHGNKLNYKKEDQNDSKSKYRNKSLIISLWSYLKDMIKMNLI